MTDLIIKEEYLIFLDDLRASGKTNMFGAATHLKAEFFELSITDAKKALYYWMTTFAEREGEVE